MPGCKGGRRGDGGAGRGARSGLRRMDGRCEVDGARCSAALRRTKENCCNERIVSDREEIAQQMVLAVGVQINATCSLVHGRKFPPR